MCVCVCGGGEGGGGFLLRLWLYFKEIKGPLLCRRPWTYLLLHDSGFPPIPLPKLEYCRLGGGGEGGQLFCCHECTMQVTQVFCAKQGGQGGGPPTLGYNTQGCHYCLYSVTVCTGESHIIMSILAQPSGASPPPPPLLRRTMQRPSSLRFDLNSGPPLC